MFIGAITTHFNEISRQLFSIKSVFIIQTLAFLFKATFYVQGIHCTNDTTEVDKNLGQYYRFACNLLHWCKSIAFCQASQNVTLVLKLVCFCQLSLLMYGNNMSNNCYTMDSHNIPFHYSFPTPCFLDLCSELGHSKQRTKKKTEIIGWKTTGCCVLYNEKKSFTAQSKAVLAQWGCMAFAASYEA